MGLLPDTPAEEGAAKLVAEAETEAAALRAELKALDGV
jgi:hypothetical protein